MRCDERLGPQRDRVARLNAALQAASPGSKICPPVGYRVGGRTMGIGILNTFRLPTTPSAYALEPGRAAP